MTLRDLYLRHFEENALDSVEITKRKNNDYAASGDPFRNFRQSAVSVGIPVEKGIRVRMGDKWCRLNNLLNRNEGPAVADETVIDTIKDLMTYANILLCWLQLAETEPDAEPETTEAEAPVEPELPALPEILAADEPLPFITWSDRVKAALGVLRPHSY